jgi:hypothetical protein
MNKHLKKNQDKIDLNKVEEPTVEYNKIESSTIDNQSNSVLEQLLQIGLKQIELGQTKPHEQVMKEMKLKYNFK